MGIKKQLGKDLMLSRKEKDLTQAQMAENFGVKQQTVGDWERTGDVPVGRRWQVKEFYGIDINDYEDDVAAPNITARDRNTISGGNMAVTNHMQKDPLSVEEQFLINLLRAKDQTKKDLLRYIQEQLAKE